MAVQDLRPLFTARATAKVRPALALHTVSQNPALVLDADTVGLLRDGLGFYDMEIRWVAHLDDTGVLRLWRSWTGYQVYEVKVVFDAASSSAALAELRVEQHPDRYNGSLDNEPGQSERVLISSVNHLRYFRAGYTPYGPSPSAGAAPEPWPATPATSTSKP